MVELGTLAGRTGLGTAGTEGLGAAATTVNEGSVVELGTLAGRTGLGTAGTRGLGAAATTVPATVAVVVPVRTVGTGCVVELGTLAGSKTRLVGITPASGIGKGVSDNHDLVVCNYMIASIHSALDIDDSTVRITHIRIVSARDHDHTYLIILYNRNKRSHITI